MIFPISQPVLVLVGPTAIGKTALSLQLARAFDCEIISMDSMQVYRHMDIGTAKATAEERNAVPHHLIDLVDPDEEYDAERFVNDCCAAIQDIHSRTKIPLITGGTGLYLRALTVGLFAGGERYPEIRARLKHRLLAEGNEKLHDELKVYDCISADKIHKNDSQRLVRALEIFYGSGVPWSQHLHIHAQEDTRPRFSKMLRIGLTCAREHLYQRINKRCDLMLKTGLEQEVRKLLAAGYHPTLKPMMSIGYRHMVAFITAKWNKEELQANLARDTRRYAKRQITWFSNTADIHWFDTSTPGSVINYVASWLRQDM